MHCCDEPVERAIRKRRSIRKYRCDPVPEVWVRAMIACAGMAPSPSNSQPVRFVRLASREVLAQLREAMALSRRDMLEAIEAGGRPRKSRNVVNACFRLSDFMFDAPVLIAVGTVAAPPLGFSKRFAEIGLIPEDARWETDADISVGLALKGFLLKAEALGLGACILTAPLIFLPQLEQRLGLDDLRIKCFLAAGFPDEMPSFIEKHIVEETYREI